jgi:hypothetical protein
MKKEMLVACGVVDTDKFFEPMVQEYVEEFICDYEKYLDEFSVDQLFSEEFWEYMTDEFIWSGYIGLYERYGFVCDKGVIALPDNYVYDDIIKDRVLKYFRDPVEREIASSYDVCDLRFCDDGELCQWIMEIDYEYYTRTLDAAIKWFLSVVDTRDTKAAELIRNKMNQEQLDKAA